MSNLVTWESIAGGMERDALQTYRGGLSAGTSSVVQVSWELELKEGSRKSGSEWK